MPNETIRVLMRRDNLSEYEATERFNEVKDIIMNESDMSYCDVEDILMYELGLEMDYILDFLY